MVLTISCVGGAKAEDLSPKVKSLHNTDPGYVLFVGNSYMFYGDGLHSHVRRLVKAASFHEGPVKYKLATISGSRLSDHNIDSYLKPGQLRLEKPFELVIMQTFSGSALSENLRKNFMDTAVSYSQKVRAAGGEPALYMTHAYVAPHKKASKDMIRKIESLYVDAGNAANALVIPVGLAFEEAYRQRPDIKLHKDFDGSHPTILGTYLAALTVFASVYQANPIGTTYDYFGAISKDDALFLQKVAQKTVREFYAR